MVVTDQLSSYGDMVHFVYLVQRNLCLHQQHVTCASRDYYKNKIQNVNVVLINKSTVVNAEGFYLV